MEERQRVAITLPQKVYEALRKEAGKDLRHPRREAEYLLTEILKARGLTEGVIDENEPKYIPTPEIA